MGADHPAGQPAGSTVALQDTPYNRIIRHTQIDCRTGPLGCVREGKSSEPAKPTQFQPLGRGHNLAHRTRGGQVQPPRRRIQCTIDSRKITAQKRQGLALRDLQDTALHRDGSRRWIKKAVVLQTVVNLHTAAMGKVLL